ncbi:MAG: hypothetical protein B7X90_10705 [Novosphingobium sp. 17-62-19]|nr:MAG: hypothetical protein B7Y74_02525 [Novosphingobium sp. 35-62-5]OZA18843.1 MAG: hypothetical protein B7X90_10705 [Novosphingobium sp. 17-62-19]
MFGKLKQHRRTAARYDKTVLSFQSFLKLAAARLWSQSFVNVTWTWTCNEHSMPQLLWCEGRLSLHKACRRKWQSGKN